jgi:hypothetical protein
MQSAEVENAQELFSMMVLRYKRRIGRCTAVIPMVATGLFNYLFSVLDWHLMI